MKTALLPSIAAILVSSMSVFAATGPSQEGQMNPMTAPPKGEQISTACPPAAARKAESHSKPEKKMKEKKMKDHDPQREENSNPLLGIYG